MHSLWLLLAAIALANDAPVPLPEAPGLAYAPPEYPGAAGAP